MALSRIWIPSPCYHGRNGARIIVLHTAEGARTYEDLGHYFQNYNNQVSSHVGIDDKRGKIGEYVSRGNAAWTQANYNGDAVAAELCGFAAWTTAQWKNDHQNMLRNAADWIAEEAKKFGIPITKLNNSQAQGNGKGVCQHVNLGAGGSGHVDCGNGFPMDYVLDLARGGTAASDTPTLIREEDILMQLVFDAGNPDAGEAPRAPIAIPNEYSRGKHKLRFTSGRNADFRVIMGDGNKSEVHTDYLVSSSVNIPDGVRTACVKLDTPGAQISVCISEQ